MRKDAYWYCSKCGFRENIWKKYYWKCPLCGNPLDLDYQIEFDTSGRGILRYEGMLPFKPEKTRGEGSTPLVIEKSNSATILFKLEYLNPSGSFKDRGTSLAIYYAYKMGFKEVVEDTSGNTGISVTLYSKVYGLKPLIVMPRTAPYGKKLIIKKLGGTIVEARDRTEASQIVTKMVHDRFYVAHTWSYFYIIGSSTIAYEVFEEYGIPDYVIAPIGSGGLFLGLFYGFKKLVELGLTDKFPKFIGVQGYSVHPVYKALAGHSVEGDSSLADGIMVSNPPRLNELVSVIRESGGIVELVGNKEIIEALRELYELGFIVEPTSAVVWAVFRRLREKIQNKVVLLPLTGSGLKITSE
ncbi:MAG: pyridoxal-phosphate dependent enzyme [Thermoprotei archaeon]